jgi:hypothetical protein
MRWVMEMQIGPFSAKSSSGGPFSGSRCGQTLYRETCLR